MREKHLLSLAFVGTGSATETLSAYLQKPGFRGSATETLSPFVERVFTNVRDKNAVLYNCSTEAE